MKAAAKHGGPALALIITLIATILHMSGYSVAKPGQLTALELVRK